ncbi:hypothetical protein [Flavobacterium sp. LC2016-01]|uniref:hypothetical protein n=1 Tax=Flavobacterium sp. LC2016-01 TaxID=2675876 RepID=UPI0012BA8DCE|nr:hypothetical protein [Flavobacterium sp. LC2016-01]MTH15533.1 hypothetical protein [Flavobacterium sp. LC2016-01]
MELKLRINSKNTFPKGGVFIKSGLPKVWLQEIQNIGLAFHLVKAFPVPGANANELFGCLLVLDQNSIKADRIGRNYFCQLIENKLFIPENTIVTPQLTKAEWHNLFSEHYHFMHPDIGLVELKEEVSWIDLLEAPVFKEIDIIEPSKTVHIPQYIASLRYEANTEDILEALEKPFSQEDMPDELPFDMEELMKGNQKEMDKFLAFLDENPEMALKLAIPLDTLGTARGGFDGKFSFEGNGSGFSGGGSFSGGRRNTINESGFDGKPFIIVFKIIFVLVMLFNLKSCDFTNTNVGTNSSLALIVIVFAIGLIIALALINNSSSSSSGSYSPPRQPSASGGGSALIDSERFATIQNRYEKMATEFKERKDYTKAAHVYMKLLKNHYKAADVLEEGELFSEAAAVHLKYCNNKNKAAECYEKGHVYKQAIELYRELNQDEKVGDLYTILKDKLEADKYYGKVIEGYKTNNQYVKASFIYKDKIRNVNAAQEVLLTGWKSNKDAFNCLNNYFVNIESTEKLSGAITSIYETEVSAENSELFLQAMKHEYKKHENLEELTKNIAYEIVADKISVKPDIASELIAFNENNKSMLKDIMKYKLKARK